MTPAETRAAFDSPAQSWALEGNQGFGTNLLRCPSCTSSLSGCRPRQGGIQRYGYGNSTQLRCCVDLRQPVRPAEEPQPGVGSQGEQDGGGKDAGGGGAGHLEQ